MARKSEDKAAKSVVPSGPLANLASAATKVLKGDGWRVVLCTDDLHESRAHVSTGSVVLDYLIGGVPNQHGVLPCPGLPRKGITQLWGPEGSGKTTLALTAAARVCAQGGTVFYLDWENAIVPDYAERLGVPITDANRFLLSQPQTLEEGLKLLKMAVLAKVDLVIIDSVGAAVPAVIAERDLGDVGEQARIGLAAQRWGEFMPDLRRVAMLNNVAVLGISQIRARISTGPGAGNGPQSEPQGGYAWKFYSDLRIEIRRVKQEKSKQYNALTDKVEERTAGGIIKAKIVKCKLSDSQGREAEFYIRSGEGIDDLRAIIEIAIAHNIVKKGGAWYNYGENKWQGLEPMRKYFKGNASAFSELLALVRPNLAQHSDEGPEADVPDEEEGDALDDIMREMVPKEKPSVDEES